MLIASDSGVLLDCTPKEFCIATNDEMICELNPGPENDPTDTMSEGGDDVLDDPEA